MGARHSTRREWSFDSSRGAGDAAGKSSHRSSSSGKLRTRWSKVARSHSDRTPTTLSVNPLNYNETPDTKNVAYDSSTEGCACVSTACQTEVQSVSIMTQTEPDVLLEFKMIDDDRCSVASDLLSKQHDVEIGRNLNSSHNSQCQMSVDSELHGVRPESLRNIRLIEAKSSLSDSSVGHDRDHIKKHDCSTCTTVKVCSCATEYLSPETDGAFNAIEHFEQENKVIHELSSMNMQWQTTKEPSVDAIIKLPDKRKHSNSSESKSLAKHLMERDNEQCGSMQMSEFDCVFHRKNTVDLGSSFGSLNSEDMMLDTDGIDDMTQSSNVTSRQSSVDASSLARRRRSSGRLLSSKSTPVPECCDYFGHEMKHNNNGFVPQRSHGRQYSEHVCNDSIDLPKHSDSVVIGDDNRCAINGRIGLDPVSELLPTEISRSVTGALPDNSTTISSRRPPPSLTADSVLYALDATTYRCTLQDVIACKTALLRMKRLLQEDELNASVSFGSVDSSVLFGRTCSYGSTPTTPLTDGCFTAVPSANELEELKQENVALKREVSKLQMLNERQRLTVELLQNSSKHQEFAAST